MSKKIFFVEMIKKGLSQCYECLPKATQKSFPGCTIRNTPSEPIHCIVWAKHLFNQLFGETDDDEEVSPDTADPEAAGDASEKALADEFSEKGNIDRVSTRQWAESCNYESQKLFTKFFHDDIEYLLSMKNLWKERRPPVPQMWTEPMDSEMKDDAVTREQRNLSLAEWCCVFKMSVMSLFKQLEEKKTTLVWDKDDQAAMDFVAACANIRSYCFGIEQKSRFEVKSMAGNIIPAIATTNAIVAGIAVMHAFKILQDKIKECSTVYVRLTENPQKQILVPEKFLNPPNPKCYVCSPKPEVNLMLDVNKMTVKELEENVLKKSLNMIAPDVICQSKQLVIISSEEGETECNNDKKLAELGIVDGSMLQVDDFLQNYELSITIHQYEPKKDEPEFQVLSDPSVLKPKESAAPA
ncbi:SUMO-activating enzyme subunit 2-like, partial [Ctenocephalides felis]|uniref:SUMO-activating enzyme subunit 2-like n=1 Tax=Ctenocephalides felis TaxID=7515 RepID=UPI000E6E31AA